MNEKNEWPGFNYTEDTDDVMLVNWSKKRLKGVMDLQWLPEGVERFNISENELSGSVETSRIPESLVDLNVFHNRFYGTLAL